MSVSDLFKPLGLLHGPEMRNRFMLAPLTNQQSELVEAGGIAFARQLGIHSDAHLPGLTKMAAAIREGAGLRLYSAGRQGAHH